MSFAINLMCGGELHQLVVDLERQLLHLPNHSAELVRRYKALYELGGMPVPCCMMAIELEARLWPGYIVLPWRGYQGEDPEEQPYAWWRAAFDGLIDDWPMGWGHKVVIKVGNDPPELIGHAGFHIGAHRGQVIKNVQAFEAKGGKTIYVPPTHRVIVGETWLLSSGRLDWPSPGNIPLQDPDPEWETAY